MDIAASLPGPFILVLSIVFDERVTARVGAELAYVLRIGCTLAVLAVSTFFLPWCSAPEHVLILGMIMGSLERSGVSSTLQLASTMDIAFSRLVFSGVMSAQCVPLVLTTVLTFSADSSPDMAAKFCAVPAALVLTVTIYFFCSSLTWCRGSWHFREAYAQLLAAAQQKSQEQRLQKCSKSLCSLDMWLPSTSNDTVCRCYKLQAILWFLDAVALPFVTFAGNYDLAGQLMLICMGAQIAGAILSSCSPRILGFFSDRATLAPSVIQLLLVLQGLCLLPLLSRVCLSAGMGDQVCHSGSISDELLKISFGISFFLGRYGASEIIVTASHAVEVGERPLVCRALLLLSTTIQVIALFLSMAIIAWVGLASP
jgi:hypothetical protein